MGYGGKSAEQERARELRAESWTLAAIAEELDVAKSSVSVWTRDVAFVPRPRNRCHAGHKPHPMKVKKEAELERCRIEAEEFVGELSERDLEVFGYALYVGEGAKTEASGLRMANTSVTVMCTYVRWLRTFFEIDETRLNARLYLHEGLDLTAAESFWSDALGIPLDRFHAAHRPVPRGEFKRSKHELGCISVGYTDVSVFRRVMAFADGITSAFAIPG